MCISIRCLMVTTRISLWLGHFVETPSLPILYQLETYWLSSLSPIAQFRDEASMLHTELCQVRHFLLFHTHKHTILLLWDSKHCEKDSSFWKHETHLFHCYHVCSLWLLSEKALTCSINNNPEWSNHIESRVTTCDWITLLCYTVYANKYIMLMEQTHYLFSFVHIKKYLHK